MAFCQTLRDDGVSYGDYLEQFNSDQDCREYLSNIKWSEQYLCRKCKHTKDYRLKLTNTNSSFNLVHILKHRFYLFPKKRSTLLQGTTAFLIQELGYTTIFLCFYALFLYVLESIGYKLLPSTSKQINQVL